MCNKKRSLCPVAKLWQNGKFMKFSWSFLLCSDLTVCSELQHNLKGRKFYIICLELLLLRRKYRPPTVNFINVKRANFTYKSAFRELFLPLCNCQKDVSTKNACVKTLMKLTPNLTKMYQYERNENVPHLWRQEKIY